MNDDFAAAMKRATALTRAGDLTAATRAIQQALAGGQPPLAEDAFAAMKVVSPAEAEPAAQAPDAAAQPRRRPVGKALGEVVRTLRAGLAGFGAEGHGAGLRPSPPQPAQAGAQFLARTHSGPAGARPYRLYVPATETPRGLVVMLHGCNQNPDDFATGTGMNAVAEAEGLIVAYPGQSGTHNAAACWNWFTPAHQRRGAGEPEILAGLAREVAAEYGVPVDAVFVAGLSAGGAMAAVLGSAYPEVFSAVGVHSGLPVGAANDMVSAFSAMQRGAEPVTGTAPRHRTIVFHGSADTTVHPVNAERIVAASARGVVARSEGRSTGGRRYTRSIHDTAESAAAVEFWLVEGAGHAWSGGQAAGSFTDPAGPDASAEMARFFLEGIRAPKAD